MTAVRKSGPGLKKMTAVKKSDHGQKNDRGQKKWPWTKNVTAVVSIDRGQKKWPRSKKNDRGQKRVTA